MNQRQHLMTLKKTYPSGADEWYCPTCGRRFLMVHGPGFRKTILEVGDEFAIHSGGKGIVQMDSRPDSPSDHTRSAGEPAISINDPSLAPWVAWLEKIGFENLWNDGA
jgi:hypothetical protein